MKKILTLILYLVLIITIFGCKPKSGGEQVKHKYDVAAFVWPAYHDAPRYKEIGIFKDGKGEWEAVYKAKSKFEGHKQPRTPLWGYLDEADPEAQEKVIETALEYGVNTFIFDWYWYDNKPFLEEALNDGFLKAKNNEKMKFYLMWANHIMTAYLDPLNSDKSKAYWTQPVTREVFDNFTDHLIKDYFTRSNYYKIDGKPVFAIYETDTFIHEIGGAEAAKEALQAFDKKCKDAGLPGVHIQPILWFKLSGMPTEKEDTPAQNQQKMIDYFGFGSLTNYQWCHFVPTNQDYKTWGETAMAMHESFGKDYSVPYFPHVSIGWDPNPRYPETTEPCVSGVTPEKFEVFLQSAKEYVDNHPGQPPLITINAWNEWAEGSYLEPDTEYGYAFLEAVKKVFK